MSSALDALHEHFIAVVTRIEELASRSAAMRNLELVEDLTEEEKGLGWGYEDE